MNRAGDQLLARAALAGDEQRRVGGRGHFHLPHDLHHAAGAAEEAPEGSALPQLAPQQLDLARYLGTLERSIEQQLKTRRIDGLGKVVVRAVLDRLHRSLDAALTGQENDRGGRKVSLEPDKKLESVDTGHEEIGNHAIESQDGVPLLSFLTV